MKSIGLALSVLLLCCLLAVVNATPGKVYINGKCIDCNRPDGDDSIVIPEEPRSGATSYALTSGAILFGALYHLLS
ncbi:uncharacterized protein LOC117890892 [Drosophila subobscura]|uniref:uncharacterized protein LOC117890892 n=1 Tax=Drosophila subobscura TaxID=7241 RepID=UPI00155A7EDC|nr:uncharacterized protein LOC117890892 [Drosophila subobscura]